MVECFLNMKIILNVDVMPAAEWYDKTNTAIRNSQFTNCKPEGRFL